MKKRILFLHHGGAIGGAPLSLLFLLQRLDRERFEPLVIFSRAGEVQERYRQANIPFRIDPRISDFSHTELVWYGNGLLYQLPEHLLRFAPSVAAVRQHLTEFRPDLVHLNTSALACGAIAARQLGIPHVWHIREPLAQGYFGWRKAWLQRQIAQATRVIAISRFDASRLLPSDKIRVIYNFVDFSQFDYRLPQLPARDRLGISPESKVVLMLGGSNPPKGSLPLMQALAHLREKIPTAQVLVAGSAPHLAQGNSLHALVRRFSGVERYDRAVLKTAQPALQDGAVRFLGARNDVPQLLAAADVLTFPAIVPHFARPIIEAAAMGKPVVASNLGGAQELVLPNQTGILVDANSPTALANGLAQILADSALARQYGQSALQFARANFNAETNAARTFAVYDEIL